MNPSGVNQRVAASGEREGAQPRWGAITGCRVAVVGAGPAGFYAAGAVLDKGGGGDGQSREEGGAPAVAAVDVFNRLPAPYGLVRDGVAPDHQHMKTAARAYAKLLERNRVRYFGNVTVGSDVHVAELRRLYDQIVYAFGAQTGRRLGIPGEDLAGSRDATSFVGWYNGHPEYRNATFALDCERVVVVGNGNVALDVARILVLDPARLAVTDIADHALRALRRSRVREVVLLGRRGPVQASFTNPELREFGRLEGVSPRVDPAELELDAASAAVEEANRMKGRNMATLRGYAGQSSGGGRTVRFRFFASPVEIVGRDGRVAGVRVERTRLAPSDNGGLRAVGTGTLETISCGLVLRSVGYRGTPTPGVPFDEARGIVPNEGGRVLGADGAPLPGEYVVGWAKRGPTGVIGTNKADAAATAALMAEDRAVGIGTGGSAGAAVDAGSSEAGGVEALLRDRGVCWVDKAGWARLDAHETAQGQARGRPRVKVCSVREMLEVAGPPEEAAPASESG